MSRLATSAIANSKVPKKDVDAYFVGMSMLDARAAQYSCFTARVYRSYQINRVCIGG